MLFIRKLTSRNNIALLFLLKLLLLALLLMLPPLNLVLRVVCHDALFVNTTVCSIASKAAALRPVPKKQTAPLTTRSILYQARWHRMRREFVDGAGHDCACERQANEKTAEDGSGDEEIQDPHDDTSGSTRALANQTTSSSRRRLLGGKNACGYVALRAIRLGTT
jgi:hypothetical protein